MQAKQGQDKAMGRSAVRDALLELDTVFRLGETLLWLYTDFRWTVCENGFPCT